MTAAELVVMPDAEALVIAALIADPDVDAVLAGRVYGVLPNVKVFPLCRVVRWSGQMLDGGDPYWGDAPALQVDVWADRKAQAVGAGEVVRAVLAQRLAGVPHAGGVVAGVDIGTCIFDPDTAFEPAKPRVRLSVDLVTRPAGAPMSHRRVDAPRTAPRPDAPAGKGSQP
jgi:Protein of unknown function (DUF3168)